MDVCICHGTLYQRELGCVSLIGRIEVRTLRCSFRKELVYLRSLIIWVPGARFQVYKWQEVIEKLDEDAGDAAIAQLCTWHRAAEPTAY